MLTLTSVFEEKTKSAYFLKWKESLRFSDKDKNTSIKDCEFYAII